MQQGAGGLGVVRAVDLSHQVAAAVGGREAGHGPAESGLAPSQVLRGGAPAQEQRGGAPPVGTGTEVERGHPHVLLAWRQDPRLVWSVEGDDSGSGCPAVAAEPRSGDGPAACQGRETSSGEEGPPGDPSAGRRGRAGQCR